MRKSTLYSLFLLFSFLLQSAAIEAATNDTIPVVVLSTNADSIHRTLTFTYGVPDKDLSRGQNGTYALNIDDNYPGWISLQEHGDTTITKAIFDESFSKARPTTTHGWFAYLLKLNSIAGIEYLNTSNVTDMSKMFFWCNRLTSLNVSNFDTKNVTNMEDMFAGCSSLTSLDVSNLHTKNVIRMNGMFQACQCLTSLDVSNFDTKNVTDMSWMFDGCNSLARLDLSNFDTNNVTNMAVMFQTCFSLISLDVSNFDTKNVTDMSYMFNDCIRLSSLNVSNFETNNVTKMEAMFQSCSRLISLDVSNFDTKNVTDMSYMFNNCARLSNLDVSNFDMQNVTDMHSMFSSCSSLKTLNLGNNDFTEASNKDETFFSIGKTSDPCTLVIGKDFDKSVLGNKIFYYYEWLKGYFAEPIVGETVMADSAGFATYAPKGDIDLGKSENVRAFKAKYNSSTGNIELTEVTAEPAGTPLIIKGTAGMNILVSAETTPDAVSDNELQVSAEDITADGSQWIYAEQETSSQAYTKKFFANQSMNAGFKKVETGTTIKAGKVYMVIDPTSVSGDFVAFDDVATGINSAKATVVSGTSLMYNLSGQRVDKRYKGLVIKDGKKVILK